MRLAGTDLRDLDMSYAVVKATFREIVGDPDRGPDIRAHPRPVRGTLLDLSASDLQDADFTGATVAEVNLQGADLRGAHFDGANLAGFDLRSACLSNTHFRGATMIGAMLGGAIGDHIDFTNAALGNVSLDPFAEDPTAARLTNLKLDGLRVLKPGDFPPLTTREYTGAAAQTMKRKIRATLEAKPDGLPSTRKALDRECDASRALKALSP